MSETHRTILGVGRNADADEILAAFRKAAKRAHPDLGGSDEAFRRVRTAADVLLAALTAGGAASPERSENGDDRASVESDWLSVSAKLRRVGAMKREPITVIAPKKIGLSPFVDGLILNLPVHDWLIRRVGPRGKDWDFHSAGTVTRLFFRREDDARQFELRFY